MMGAATILEPTEALKWCKLLVRRRAGNFYWGLRLLPEPRRSGLYALYAWMRQADDITDDADDPATAMQALGVFERTTLEVLDGGLVPKDHIWQALSWTASSWSLPRQPFVDMIRGQRDDLSGRVIESNADLVDYCECVASTVGLLCISIWGFDDPAAPELAVKRGIALQLTNILRDVGEDAAVGRCYIPASDLRARGLDQASLVAWRRPEACESLIRYWIDVASSHYEQSQPLDAMVSADCRRTLRAMTGIYHAMLGKIAQDPQRCCGIPGVSLSKLKKIRIALSAGRAPS